VPKFSSSCTPQVRQSFGVIVVVVVVIFPSERLDNTVK
jgi:hypothetical protein